MGGKRITYEYVKNFLEAKGYHLLSTSLKDSKTILQIRCPEGHMLNKRWNDIQQSKQLCHFSPCNVDGMRGMFTYSYVKEQVESVDGYRLLSSDFKTANHDIDILCPHCGKTFTTSYRYFIRQRMCPCQSSNYSPTNAEMIEYFESQNYHWIGGEHINAFSPLMIRCPKGHEYISSWNKFHNCGYRCHCQQPSRSRPEKAISDYVKSIYQGTVEENMKFIPNPLTGRLLELDIWLPDINKAIEFNGVYWHKFDKVKQRDRVKSDYCAQNNIKLLVIEESLWNEDFRTIQEFILN